MTQCLILNDGMAVLRARLERDLARFSLTKLLNEIDASPHLQFWIFDGSGNKKSRQEILPEYKANRKPSCVSIYEGMMLMKEALKFTKAVVITVPGVEADDVIAECVKRFQGKMPIVINTRDYDLRALCSEKDNVMCTVEKKEGLPDELIRLYKSWVGDPADNIKGVRFFGEKSWKNADLQDIRAVTDAVLNKERRIPSAPTIADRSMQWLRNNQDKFRAMHTVIGFLDVPDEIFTPNMVVGTPNEVVRRELMSRYFL